MAGEQEYRKPDPADQKPGADQPAPSMFAPPPVPPEKETSTDARNLGMLCHLLGAFVGILGPLIIWLIKKDELPFVADQGKEAVNFHLSLIVAYLVSAVGYFLISLVTCGFGAFLFLPAVVGVAQLVFGIIAGIKASEGEYYRYPYNIRFIK
ncbi:MAG: DUF4870 domain-containing protein [Pirellulaceae bacterium]|nr:DUF4870 domain-containing protein [Pirellulaceae bacterium]